MSKTFEQGKDEIAKLCRYFAANRQAFLAPGINPPESVGRPEIRFG